MHTIKWILLSIILLLILPVNATTNLKYQTKITVDSIERARSVGSNVSDLVNKLNKNIEIIDLCGWEKCNEQIISNYTNALIQIRNEANERYRQRIQGDYWLITIIVIIPILYILWKKYSTDILWIMIKHRRIKYN